MRDEDEGRPAVHDLPDPLEAFLREENVPHAQGLVDDQDVGLDADRHGEGEPHHHARGVGLDRLLDEVADVRERRDLLEAARHLAVAQAEDRAVEEHVFPGR